MKIALITGVSRGIGKSLAEKFLNEGHYVIGTSTNGDCDLKNDNLKILQLDLSNTQSISDCVSAIKQIDKGIDILINNAGILVNRTNAMDATELRRTLEVNLIGTIDFAEQIIPILNNDAHILNASSSAGSLTKTEEDDDDEFPAYRISKNALNMYTRTLAIRLRGKIVVYSYHPGWVKTDMGGEEAPMSPYEAAGYIYDLAMSKVPSGQFWFKGEKYPW